MSRLNNRIKKLEGVSPTKRIPIAELGPLAQCFEAGRKFVTVAEFDERLRAAMNKTRGVKP